MNARPSAYCPLCTHGLTWAEIERARREAEERRRKHPAGENPLLPSKRKKPA
jgi:hypothetical protein